MQPHRITASERLPKVQRFAGHGGKRYWAAVTLVLFGYIVGHFFAWQGASFLEVFLVLTFFVLGGRLWDLQHEATEHVQKTAEVQLTLAEVQLTLAKVQHSLDGDGRRLLQVKGVSLDVTEQLWAIERKLDAMRNEMPPKTE